MIPVAVSAHARLHVRARVAGGATGPLAPLVAGGSAAAAGPWQVVADATLYYRDDLRARLRSGGNASPVPTTAPEGPGHEAAALIASALEAQGPAAIAWLEGDFAFIAWHRITGEIIAARDFAGRRPLHYASVPDGLVLSSDAAQLLAEPDVEHRLNIARVAAVAAGLWCHGNSTAYAAIQELPAGSMLQWTAGRAPRLERFWEPPQHIATRRAALEPAADELRALLDDAVRERLATPGRSAVSLSGGWDSTAVYGTAMALQADVHAVSVSYPAGDPGREDEFIRDVASFWQVSPDFIDVDDIPLAHDWRAEAAQRSLPFAHAYEQWNRAIAARARAAGATVLLDGVGGDQLFQCSDAFLSDLVRGGQWLEAIAQVRRTDGGFDWMRLRQSGLAPLLPSAWRRASARRHGRFFKADYLERLPPRWFRHDSLRDLALLEHERRARPPQRVRNAVLAEGHAYLEFAYFPRIYAMLNGFSADAGLEQRSPLLDQRLVRFALQRPWSDRVDRGETKRLLRRAMRGRLPDRVLAARPHRTGTTEGYFLRKLRAHAWPEAQTHFRNLRLADLRLVDVTEYERAWQYLLQHDDGELAARVFFTFTTELWLRTHLP